MLKVAFTSKDHRDTEFVGFGNHFTISSALLNEIRMDGWVTLLLATHCYNS